MGTFYQAYKAFQGTQETYARFGACDTEPRCVFRLLMEDLYDGKEPIVPTTAQGWQLYSGEGQRGVGLAAAALTRSARRCIEAAKTDLFGFTRFIRAY